MKQLFLIATMYVLLSSCETSSKLATATDNYYPENDSLLTQSLFNDKNATISEEAIQKILDGSYQLPQQLRVSIVKLQSSKLQRRYWSFWNDEDYLKSQQKYLDLFTSKLKQSNRITKIDIVPDLLISSSPNFTNIREAAVRMQSDIVIIYAISGDIYSKYKLFSKAEIKAFATTQLIVMDVRTGLIPFSTIVSKDYLSQKQKEELDNDEAIKRIQDEAVLLSIDDIGNKLLNFLGSK